MSDETKARIKQNFRNYTLGIAKIQGCVVFLIGMLHSKTRTSGRAGRDT
jgi:hypothetical protein